VYLFIWSQTGAPFSARTEIQSAALDLEHVAIRALDEAVRSTAQAAVRRPLRRSAFPPGLVSSASSSIEPIPFELRRIGNEEEEQALIIIEPAPLNPRIILPFPGDEGDNLQYRVLAREAEERELLKNDPAGAEEVLDHMAGSFDGHGFQFRLTLLRAAYLKRRDRQGDAREPLLELIRIGDRSSAPGRDELPFAVQALLLLGEGARTEGGGLDPACADLLEDMAKGAVPLNASELRAAAARLKWIASQTHKSLLSRAAALDLVERMESEPGLLKEFENDTLFAAVAKGILWLGGANEKSLLGLAFPSSTGLEALLRETALAGIENGLSLTLADQNDAAAYAALDESVQEVVRTRTAPGGIHGALLRVCLTDRSIFEESVESRRTFILGAALCLVLALAILGFATFRAIRREVAAAKARSDFMAGVSHELRTPLASIRMFAELMQDERVEDAATGKRFMRLIISNCRRLTAMIENVLDLSRSEKGLMRFHLEEVELKDLLDDLFGDISAFAEEEGIEMQVEIDPNLPAVRADPTALARAIFNLVDNARKYSGEEKSIKIEAVSKQGGAMISVSDEGPGIAPEERERIFERFQRGADKGDAPTGAGLGLSLAREAVKGCGGTLTLDSNQGRGAKFLIYLPGLEEQDEHAKKEDPDN